MNDLAAGSRKKRTLFSLRRFVQRVMAWGRVTTYAAAVFAFFGVLAARTAYGDVSDATLSLGRQLASFEDLTGRSYRVHLNGEVVNVANVTIDEPLERVLERFEAHCERGTVLPPELLAAGLEEVGGSLKFPDGAEMAATGVIARRGEWDGVVACLVASDAERFQPFSERLSRFAETLDVSEIGYLRYGYAKRTADGRTNVLTLWTNWSFHLGALLPPEGRDAPGDDIRNAPRPVDSLRLLSADIEGAPYGCRFYESTTHVAEVLTSLDRDMGQAGWEELRALEEHAPGMRVYSREGVDIYALAESAGAGSIVTLVETSHESLMAAGGAK